VALLGWSNQLPAQTAPEGKPEIRVFVLDKAGSPVNIQGWTGAVEVTPENGTAKSYKLMPAMPGQKDASKEHSKSTPEPERYSNSQDFTNRTSPEADGYADGQQATQGKDWKDQGKDRMLCGEARSLDDGWVEMIVVWPKMQQGKHAEHDGFRHDHGAGYFRAPVDEAALKDTKTNTVNFSARGTFTTPSGDTKYVKGFTYPAGMIDGSLGHLIDKDFKDTSKFDHDQAARIARRVNWALEGLPALAFAKDGDRQEYEKAKADCKACSQRLEQATGKDISKAADDCKSALKEVRSQAGDAQGAMMAQ